MSEPFDFSLIDEAIIQAKEKEQEYDTEYSEYIVAMNNTIDILINLAMSSSPEERQAIAEEYRGAMVHLYSVRKRTDKSHLERTNMLGTIINIVNMMREEFLVVIRRHERKIKELEQRAYTEHHDREYRDGS